MPATPADTPHYHLFPRVVPEGWSGALRVTGDYAHARLVTGVAYSYTLTSMRWFADSKRRRQPLKGKVRADRRGELAIPFKPDMPGEWVLVVTSDDKRVRTLPTLGLYVQDPAMYCYRPYLGDLHAHSTGSDGRQEPAYCAMRARWHGFDFFALTDHNNFASSAEMMRKARPRLGRRMLLLRGEELHTAPAPYHYVGIGHRQSVEALRKTQRRQYHRELRRILDELKGRRTAPHLDLVAYAEGLWKIRKARELGGLALYAHPYWSYQNTLCLDEAEREQAFLDREFDAVEVTTTADHTFLMSNRLARETLDRGPVSIVGISDSHNWGPAGTSGRHWTYIMAEGLTRRSLFDAIRNRRSLACEDVGGRLRLEGPFELVDFADFYHRKLLPLRRRITRLEAELALSSLRQGPYDREVVEKLDEELDALDRSMWA